MSACVSGCRDIFANDKCLLLPYSAVKVSVQDAQTGKAAGRNAHIVVSRRGGETDSTTFGADAIYDANVFGAPISAGGVFDVSVSKPGYAMFATTVTVRMSSDGCSPVTQNVVANLQPLPGSD